MSSRRIRPSASCTYARRCGTCRKFLPHARADHYCAECRRRQKRARRRLEAERAPRFMGQELIRLMDRYFT
jgi:hypothetical protein